MRHPADSARPRPARGGIDLPVESFEALQAGSILVEPGTLPLLLCVRPCCLQKSRKLPPTWKYESSTASALVA